jgi:hypothetical protein
MELIAKDGSRRGPHPAIRPSAHPSAAKQEPGVAVCLLPGTELSCTLVGLTRPSPTCSAPSNTILSRHQCAASAIIAVKIAWRWPSSCRHRARIQHPSGRWLLNTRDWQWAMLFQTHPIG